MSKQANLKQDVATTTVDTEVSTENLVAQQSPTANTLFQKSPVSMAKILEESKPKSIANYFMSATGDNGEPIESWFMRQSQEGNTLQECRIIGFRFATNSILSDNGSGKRDTVCSIETIGYLVDEHGEPVSTFDNGNPISYTDVTTGEVHDGVRRLHTLRVSYYLRGNANQGNLGAPLKPSKVLNISAPTVNSSEAYTHGVPMKQLQESNRRVIDSEFFGNIEKMLINILKWGLSEQCVDADLKTFCMSIPDSSIVQDAMAAFTERNTSGGKVSAKVRTFVGKAMPTTQSSAATQKAVDSLEDES